MVHDGDRVFASWTRSSDRRVVVAQVAPGDERLVWEGPVAGNVASAGRLIWRDGRLGSEVGDLGRGQPDPAASAPDAPDLRGSVLELDPDAGPEQRPTVLSSGLEQPVRHRRREDGRDRARGQHRWRVLRTAGPHRGRRNGHDHAARR